MKSASASPDPGLSADSGRDGNRYRPGQKFPEERIVIITTGSQGEPMSAFGAHGNGTPQADQDPVRRHGGPFVQIHSWKRKGHCKHHQQKLYKLGADVIYEKISAIHVSGHAFREELKMMIHLTGPGILFPFTENTGTCCFTAVWPVRWAYPPKNSVGRGRPGD